VLAIVLLFLTGPFSHLPETTLAAIVIVAVKGLIDIPALRRLFNVSKADFLAALLTMLGVLTFGMLEGIIIGVLFSFLALLKRVSLPTSSILGLRPGSNDFVDVERHPQVEVYPEVMIFRPNAALFYGNAAVTKEQLVQSVEQRATPPEMVVFDLASAAMVDLGTLETLGEIDEELDGKNIELRLANVYSAVNEFIDKAGYADQLGPVVPDADIAEVLAGWRDEAHSQKSTESTGAEDAVDRAGTA
jgi:SulP family sulfate permease